MKVKNQKDLRDNEIHFGIYAKYFKRLFDFLISFIVLVVFSPFFVVLCILVRIKLGSPVFFKQTRAGKDEIPFQMIKFRSMTNARDEVGKLLPDTERFTKFGNFLRNSSLDEIPELINVLKGDMSFIGPRPLYTYYLPYYTEEEALRHAIRGGITGLAQINGRALCRWNDRFAYDVKYVKNITLINDIKILWQTVYKVFNKSDIGVPSVTDEGGVHILRDIQRPYLVKEIGSTFSAADTGKVSQNHLRFLVDNRSISEVVYLSTGRSCIREILNNLSIENKRVIVPSFTCESVIEPFIENGYEIFPYSLNEDLTIDIDALISQIERIKPSVLLFHRYFGFDTCDGIEGVIDSYPELITIEDKTQYMFSDKAESKADYQIGSIRKWLPVPDGAYLISKEKLLEQPTVEDSEFVRIELEAMDRKQSFLDKKIEDRSFQDLFAQGREYLYTNQQTFSISKASVYTLESYNWASFKEARRKNAAVLINGLQGYSWFNCVFTELFDGVVPFMIPLFVYEGRKEFQSYLASQKVFATVIWACPDLLKNQIGKADEMIYREILCIPCDQRYSEEDMERIVLTVKKYDRKMRMANAK